MEKYFANYNQALALKELGFKEICFGYFRIDLDGKFISSIDGMKGVNDKQRFMTSDEFGLINHESRTCYVSAPLKSQVFEWFRKNHDLVIEPCVPFQRTYQTEDDHFEILEFGYRIFTFDQFRGGQRDTIEWDGYDNEIEEVAESACIDKLIEIVKNK